ncbi:MAG: molecular chaperone TorD family protein [Acidobacteria bacterium]|nr:molecular chaperone TorD family protein [Acidobacteriota bacterium]
MTRSADAAAVDAALARAVVYRLLSIAFQPPTLARLKDAGAADGFRGARVALEHLDGLEGRSRLGPLAAQLKARAPSEEVARSRYWHLFGHTVRGLICACETEYGPDNGFHQPQQLADIAGYYLAFGLRPSAGAEVRADHIACECEFMDFLSRKQAYLLDRPDEGPERQETLEATELAARSFLRDHVGRFGRAFAAQVTAGDEDGYFGALGRLLFQFVEGECRRVGVASGPVDLALRPEAIDRTPMACGASDELLQIQRRVR